MTTQNTQNQQALDSINWELAGIAGEKQRLEARLNYLTERERTLRNQGLTGSTRSTKTGKKTTSTTAVKTRKRTLSAEHRQKMSEAAKKRWEARRQSTAQAEQVVPPPMEAAQA